MIFRRRWTYSVGLVALTGLFDRSKTGVQKKTPAPEELGLLGVFCEQGLKLV